jgi:hypothetical protein
MLVNKDIENINRYFNDDYVVTMNDPLASWKQIKLNRSKNSRLRLIKSYHSRANDCYIIHEDDNDAFFLVELEHKNELIRDWLTDNITVYEKVDCYDE